VSNKEKITTQKKKKKETHPIMELNHHLDLTVASSGAEVFAPQRPLYAAN